MSVRKSVGFNCGDIIANLKNDDGFLKNKTRRKLLLEMIEIVEFVFSGAIQDFIWEFNRKFDSKVGNVAYDRTMLLGIYLYCMKRNRPTLSEISEMCVSDEVVKIFTCNQTPSLATLKRFLEDDTKCLEFRKIFLYTLVKANDLKLLKFLYAFIDGTDAIVKGSKHYKITHEQLKALKLFKKWGILLKNKKVNIDYWKTKLNNKKNEITDKKTLELIKIAENNPYIFTKSMAKKIPIFEESFKQTTKDYISIMFPKAIMMPTKKGGFDFAFNLQSILTEYKIVIGKLLHKEPNDYHSIDEIMKELRTNFKILKEMVREYGNRNNLKEIENLLDKAVYVMDSGYFSNYNLEKTEEENMNVIIMSKQVSKTLNKEFRKNRGITEKKKKKKSKSHKDSLKRTIKGYECKAGETLELVEKRYTNSKKNKKEGISDNCKEKEYIYICNKCKNCNYKKECIGDDEYKIIKERMTELGYETTIKIFKKSNWDTYRKRFHVSEGINGYMKRTNGVLLLLGSSEAGINNEMYLRNTVYNLFRIKTLKDTLP